MISKTVEIKFDVNWMRENQNETLNNLLQQFVYDIENKLDRRGFAVVNIKCNSKVYCVHKKEVA